METLVLNGRQVGVRQRMTGTPLPDHPLIVAIHGGTYTSAYFDVGDWSLLDQAEALRFPIIAVDRPGYGGALHHHPDELTHEGGAAVLERWIGDYCAANAASASGVVLVGHSIGGLVAAHIAARNPSWPLLGIAISGLGMHHKPGHDEVGVDPSASHLEMPAALKDFMMFGPAETFQASARDLLHGADAPAPTQDVIDIVQTWPNVARSLLARIEVPIHYRQAEFDAIWTVDEQEVRAFSDACTRSPWVDAGIFRDTGHCIDHHRVGSAFQLEQLAFAIKCAVASRRGG